MQDQMGGCLAMPGTVQGESGYYEFEDKGAGVGDDEAAPEGVVATRMMVCEFLVEPLPLPEGNARSPSPGIRRPSFLGKPTVITSSDASAPNEMQLSSSGITKRYCISRIGMGNFVDSLLLVRNI